MIKNDKWINDKILLLKYYFNNIILLLKYIYLFIIPGKYKIINSSGKVILF